MVPQLCKRQKKKKKISAYLLSLLCGDGIKIKYQIPLLLDLKIYIFRFKKNFEKFSVSPLQQNFLAIGLYITLSTDI